MDLLGGATLTPSSTTNQVTRERLSYDIMNGEREMKMRSQRETDREIEMERAVCLYKMD